LGHIGIQLAAKMGFRTVAIGGGGDKDDLARKLGAEHYIDTGAEAPAAAPQALGGARTILATVPSGKAVSPLIGGLGVRPKLVVVGVSPEPIETRALSWSATAPASLAMRLAPRSRARTRCASLQCPACGR
jgi:D-arabinose 1-dehydrogenase-like Zn-dependent alcohol dehydrogenase